MLLSLAVAGHHGSIMLVYMKLLAISDRFGLRVFHRSLFRAAVRGISYSSMAALLLLLTGTSLLAMTSKPQDVIEHSLDNIIAVLANPAQQGEQFWPEKKKKVIAIINANFDFEEMSKRCLARAWRKRSSAEKEHFVTIFQELLQNTYIDRLKTVADGSVKLEDVLVRGKKAVVKTSVLQPNKKYSFIFKLRQRNDKWAIYDIIVEGVSLVSNYRSQFSQVIGKNGYPALVSRIEKKLRPVVSQEYSN